jgi:LPXTG-motif cell wall-anchored protein
MKGEARHLRRSRTLNAFVLVAVVLGVSGLSRAAHADPTSCFVSSTTVRQGATFTVSGDASAAPEGVRAVLDGTTQIGFGSSSGGPPTFSFTARIPASTSAPAMHSLAVQNPDGGGGVECPSIFVTQSAAAADDDADDDDDAAADDDDDAEITPAPPAAPQQPQQQQQQQQTILPVAIPAVAHAPVGHSSGDPVLPKTGSRTQAMGLYGAATLLAGLMLVAFSRRARLALGTVGAVVLRRTPVSEADLLLPYGSDDQ